MKSILLIFFSIIFTSSLFSQQSNDSKQSIISEAIFEEDGTLTVSWIPKSGTESYRIQVRSDLNQAFQIEATGVTDSFYVFTMSDNEPMEVAITTENGDPASSYILTGNEYFNVDKTEHMLLIVTDTINSQLGLIIQDYQSALEKEMITSEVIVVAEEDNVTDIKEMIITKNDETPINYILLVGHVAVPYSGNSAIDGHTPDHLGAWVADGYYGDLDGVWTDVTVNNDQASRDANKNIPGDGKFDQTIFPSDIEISVGRVDFSNLPKLAQGEIELTERYFIRNIAYRSGEIKANRRAVIDNNFNLAEGFAQGAIKSFHTFLEPDSINYGAFSQTYTKDYLFSFGAGGGSYQSAGGITSTNALVNDSIQSIFTTIFGSYFGDWDIENNLLRTSLARGNSLTNAWSGRPVWYFQHMSMGHPIGNVLVNTQNNNGNYTSVFGNSYCHISLLGDPSLKMYYHEPITDVVVSNQEIVWNYSAIDEEVVGYTVYYQDNDEWILIGDGPQMDSSLPLAEIPVEGEISLLIRPVGFIESRSGSYYNEGQGVFVSASVTNTKDIEYISSVSPNPASDYLSISSPNDIGQVVIYDLQGRVVLRSYGMSEIYIGTLIDGPYLLHVNNEVLRFIKQ